jgi:hypothetical protein
MDLLEVSSFDSIFDDLLDCVFRYDLRKGFCCEDSILATFTVLNTVEKRRCWGSPWPNTA